MSVAEALRIRQEREKSYRERALKLFPKFVGVVGESSVESGYVNSQCTIKITIMTIIHLMEVAGNCCVFIVTMNLFESIKAVKRFAGSDYDVPVFEPEARRLLSKVEPIARHYDVKVTPKI